MMIRVLALTIILSLPGPLFASLRGNLNVNYQESKSEINPKTWSTSQIMNIYLAGRIFHSNDYLLGAYILRTSNSIRTDFETKIRYSLNLTGYRYRLYTTYSPFKIHRTGLPDQYNRIFQVTLNYQPKMVPDFSVTYASSRIFTKDEPRTEDALNHTWTANTQFSRKFGTFRGTYWRQKTRPQISLPERQIRTTKNFSYNLARTLPARVRSSVSYTYTGNDNDVIGKAKSKSISHTGAASVGRQFGRLFGVTSAFSGRNVDFTRFSGEEETIKDYSANIAGTLSPKKNLSFTFLRGYNSNESINDSTIQLVNDYFNFGANYIFPLFAGREASLSISRAVYLKSNLGKSIVDNGSFVADIEIYRQTDLTLNLGISHNNKSISGHGRYQMTRNINIVSRPLPQTTVTLNHQASGTREKLNLAKSDNENFSIILSQTLKGNFNYTFTYSRAISKVLVRSTARSISGAANYRLSRAISLLLTYANARISGGPTNVPENSSESISGRVGWMLTRKSSLTVNYTISNMNKPSESQNLGGYFVTSF